MKRGDIVIGAQRGDFTSKPRPYVVVQRETTLSDSATVTVCPVTTILFGSGDLRIPLDSDATTGLDEPSEVEVDRITTLRRSRIRRRVGSAPAEGMAAIDRGLKLWLDL
ncbi:type II toxin-antitoxin system PemK/MazF family toxin [uncultured Sphingomonas sp.]|uniref:type II toxin-antitoxin system PemK/MazF family toxin n=1 Tax=uncultured Sphingomonas sp. TaxID=158754 RepID=UPI0035CBC0E7